MAKKMTLINYVGWALLALLILGATFYTGYEYAKYEIRQKFENVMPKLNDAIDRLDKLQRKR